MLSNFMMKVRGKILMSYITSLKSAIIVENEEINVLQDSQKRGGYRLLVDV